MLKDESANTVVASCLIAAGRLSVVVPAISDSERVRDHHCQKNLIEFRKTNAR